MSPSTFHKATEIETPLGRASVIYLQELRLLVFTRDINWENPISKHGNYSSFIWDDEDNIQDITIFPFGPLLPGHLLIDIEEAYVQRITTLTESPLHVSHFLNNVLAGLVATFIGK